MSRSNQTDNRFTDNRAVAAYLPLSFYPSLIILLDVFSIFDTITKDAPPTEIDGDYIKLGEQPKPKELTASVSTKAGTKKDYHYVYSIFDSIGLT